MKRHTSSILIMVGLLYSAVVAAENPIIINNNVQQPQQAPSNNSSNCNNQSNNNQGPPPGTYYQTNPHGGTDTVYSTGNKQPYVVDNNCNNNSVIQPYVYAQPPGPPMPPVRGK